MSLNPNWIYKLLTRSDWDEAQREGLWLGSAVDRRDGFIHFSTATQLAATEQKYFAGASELYVMAFDPDSLGAALRFEPARDGQLFPHLYARLLVASACQAGDARELFTP